MSRLQLRVLSALIFLMSLLLAPLASAQPGNEAQVIHSKVNSLQEHIAEAGRRIEAEAGDPRLYASRGSLYADLYRALYEDYYKHFYGPKPPDLEAAVVTTKAIEDFGRAIELGPLPELFFKRGEMYEARWGAAVTSMRYSAWKELTKRRSPNDMWTWLTRPPTEDAELEALGTLVNNPDFAAAAYDYVEAMRLDKDAKLAKEIHARLARLYLSRTRAFPFHFQSVKRIVNEPNRFGYLIWADFDKALEHFSKIDRAAIAEPEWDWVWPRGMSKSKAYFEKAQLAVGYGKYEVALEALNMAEQYFDPNLHFLGYTECEIRSERSKVRVKLGQFDAAIADASCPGGRGVVCGKAYEPRGDAYFAKGDWRAAAADYTAGLEDTYSQMSDNARRNRAIAYVRSGETEKAVKELGYCFDSGRWQRSPEDDPEDYRLCAQLFRKLGREELAISAEKAAKEVEKAAKSKVEEVYFLGEIRMPDGVPFDRMKVEVVLIDAADPKRRTWTTVGDDARIIVSYEKGRSFTVHVFYDGVKDGKPVRFSGHTRKLTANGNIGPIIITLDQPARNR